MASAPATGGGKPFWSDTEIVVDKDGIPHYTGEVASLMKEYRRRVLFAYATLEGEGDSPEKEAADLDRKQKRFALKLVNCLHGEAWKTVEPLVLEPSKLRKVDGYKEIFTALQQIEKEGIIRKTEAFDHFFEHAVRRRGEPIDQYLRKKLQAWQDLCDLDETSAMSEDLLSYFLLKGCHLSREDRRAILLANKNAYERKGIEQSLRVSFHDLHEREKTSWRPEPRRQPGRFPRRGYAVQDEDVTEPEEAFYGEYDEYGEENGEYEGEDWEEEAMQVQEEDQYEEKSDCGASQDGDVGEAYAVMNKNRSSYQEARRKLRDVQKSRGFYKASGGGDERRQLIEREKSKSRCSACHQVGHWAGDVACPKTSKAGPHRGKGKNKGKGKGKSGKSKGPSKSAYWVSADPTYFSLEDLDEDEAELVLTEAYCMMVHTTEDDDEKGGMDQDAGYTELDDRRKKPDTYADSTDWEKVSETPMPRSSNYHHPEPTIATTTTALGRSIADQQEVIRPKIKASVETVEVESFAKAVPKNLETLKAFELQSLCEKWGIQTSGSKQDLRDRLEQLFNGGAVPKKNCTVKFLRLVEETPSMRTLGCGDGVPVDRGKGSGIFRSYIMESEKGKASGSQEPPVLRAQRGVQERGAAAYASMAKTGMPKNNKKMPKAKEIGLDDLELGESLDDMACYKCTAPMVLRQNRSDAGYFFACSQFPKTRCSFTRPLFEGLDILNGKVSGAVRFPRGGL